MSIILTKGEILKAVSEYIADKTSLEMDDKEVASMKLINLLSNGIDFEMLVEVRLDK